MYKNVKLFPEVRDICNYITDGKVDKYTEMTVFQHAFLCGLVREKRPNKIVEIGVAAGATTAIVLTCLKELNLAATMYSVDIGKEWYRGGGKTTGFVAQESKANIIGRSKHEFLLGQSIPYVINQIGKNIDFLILDTAHSLPGELLDFLICLPYLKDGCVVVLHDMIENFLRGNKNEIATKLLFDTVTAEKYYMVDKEDYIAGLSNIGAFIVTEETRKNIRNVISALSMSWEYLLQPDEEKLYLEHIHINYHLEEYNWVERVFKAQRGASVNAQIIRHYRQSVVKLKLLWKHQKIVYLYGAGHWGKIYMEFAKMNHLPVKGYVISNERDKPIDIDYPVYKLEELCEKPDEAAFVIACEWSNFSQIERALAGYGYYKII